MDVSPGYFPGNKGLTPPRTLVVEQNPITSVHIVGLAVVDNRPQMKGFSILPNKIEITKEN